MNKFLKLIAKIAALLIVIYILLTVLIYFFVHPDTYKPLIKKAFYKATGRQITIDGKMQLLLFPAPALKVKQVNIANPAGFKAPNAAKYFAKIGTAEIQLRLFPLFKAEFHPSKLLLSDASVNLITTQSGKNNWSDLFTVKANGKNQTKNLSSTTTRKSDPAKSNSNIPNILFPTIIISKTSLHFINQQTQHRIDLTNLTVRTKSIKKGNAYSFEIGCMIHRNNPNMLIKFHSTSIATLNLQKQYYRFDKLKIVTELMQFKNVQKPETLELNGNLTIWNQNIHSLFNGFVRDQKGKIKITINKKNSLIYMSLSAKQLPIERVITAFTGKTLITGILNFKTKLTTHGNSMETWIKELDGNGQFKLTDGAIFGLNLQSTVVSALNSILLGKNIVTIAPDDKTPRTSFNEISADYQVNNGLLSSRNILLGGDQLKASGEGNVSLPKETINLRMLVTYSPKPNLQIPIAITGDLFAPKVHPDIRGIANQLLKSKIQKDIGKALKDINLKKLFD